MSLTGLFGAEPLRLARLVGVERRIAWHRRSSPAYKPSILKSLYAGWARWELERSSTCILSNSEAALDKFHGNRWRDKQLFKVIPNGVDSQRFRPVPSCRLEVRQSFGLPDSALVIGHIGRFDPAKDHETLFTAIRLARQAGLDAWLLCAGTGTDLERFHGRLKVHGISEYTLSLGARSDVAHLHHAMDVFVFPSITEGQPNALIEAMLSGIPILASDIPPIREAVPEFLYSDLFAAGDADGIARKVADLDIDDSRKIEMARNWAIDRYDPQRNFGSVLELMGC
jgi:glycosyltransferase involved in cell wall biosynthesis